MSKKVLILSTKNHSRSIIAHALLNKYFKEIITSSAGLSPTKKLDPNVTKLLQKEKLYDENIASTNFSLLEDKEFDLVLILCEKTMQKIPNFSSATKILFLDYDVLEGSNFSNYEQTFKEMKMELIPIIRMEL